MPFQNISNDQLDQDFYGSSAGYGDADLMLLIEQKARKAGHNAALERDSLSWHALFQLADLMCGFIVGSMRDSRAGTTDGRILPRYRAYFVFCFSQQHAVSTVAKFGGITGKP